MNKKIERILKDKFQDIHQINQKYRCKSITSLIPEKKNKTTFIANWINKIARFFKIKLWLILNTHQENKNIKYFWEIISFRKNLNQQNHKSKLLKIRKKQYRMLKMFGVYITIFQKLKVCYFYNKNILLIQFLHWDIVTNS